MDPNKPASVVGYARVSTENQRENYSIPQQEERLKAYCAAKGWRLLNIYVDGGWSGSGMNRPALGELLEAVERGGIDGVVVYKLDRLSRSQKDTLYLIEDRFLAHGTDFISINENFDTSTPFGRAMIGMLSVFAQLERDQITERFTMGRIGRTKAGYFHGGGSPPTGYDYVDGLLRVNEYEALQVREAYRLFLAGGSVNQVSRILAEKYAPSWTASKVRSVLKNSLYTGKVRFQGQEYPGLHQPLVDQASFQEANRLLDSLKVSSPQRTAFRAKYLLSGLLYCARCGGKFAAGHGYYQCYSRSKSCKKYIRDPLCQNRRWPIEALDRLVVKEVEALLSSPRNLALLSASVPPALGPEPAGIAARLEAVDRQLDRLVELYQLGDKGLDTVAGRIQALSREKEALLRLRQAEPASQTEPDPARAFFQGFQRAPTDRRRAFLSSLIQRVEIDGLRVRIRWKI